MLGITNVTSFVFFNSFIHSMIFSVYYKYTISPIIITRSTDFASRFIQNVTVSKFTIVIRTFYCKDTLNNFIHCSYIFFPIPRF